MEQAIVGDWLPELKAKGEGHAFNQLADRERKWGVTLLNALQSHAEGRGAELVPNMIIGTAPLD